LAKVICDNDPAAKLIVGLVEELSQIGYKIVIEGVEEQEMFDILVEIYSNASSGFLYQPACS
jgi:EAL domain-containing protein (putative c-di-GMP-specific phosphodiesterase class I)